MSEANLPMNQPTPGIVIPSKTKKVKKDSFTKLQSILLILLTLVISVGGYYGIGKTFFWGNLDMKRVDAQLEYLKQKVQATPSDPKARVELGYTYFLKGKNDLAIQELNQVLLLDPKNFDGYYNLGIVMLDEKRYNEALEKFQKAVDLSPRDYKGHLQKGVTYRNLGMYKEASAAVAQANKLLPGNADIIYETGRIAEAQGQKDAAIDIYKEALSYDPLFKDAVTALQRLEKK
ncbi:MAG: tetratricopeptide repeat protein [Desulfitobacteriaceae bacterium]